MIRLNLILILLLFTAGARAQSLTNTGFENWSIEPYETPGSYWISSNYSSIPDIGKVTATKVAGQASAHAIRLETINIGSDLAVGYIVNSVNDIASGEGGKPYTGTPTMFNGFYRYSLPGLDTAIIIVAFKNAGTVISSDTLFIKGSGSQTTFAPFSMPLSLAALPDSVIIIAMSSNLIGGNFVNIENGSWLELDNLQFTGGPTPPIPDGNFEQWVSRSFETPDGWNRGTLNGDAIEPNIKRSTDKNGGTYAVELITAIDSALSDTSVIVGSINAAKSIPMLGADTLVGYYKYTPVGNDSAAILCYFNSNTAGLVFLLPPTSVYIPFSVPLVNKSGLGANKVDIEFVSSYKSGRLPVAASFAGSALLVDDLSIKAASVGINEVEKQAVAYSVYPNPAKNVLNISLNAQRAESVRISLVDAKGSVVYTTDNTLVPGTALAIPVSQLAPGMYFYSIKGANGEMTDKFYKD